MARTVEEERVKKLCATDSDARFLSTRTGFDLACTAGIAVLDDHLIVAQPLDAAGRRQSLARTLVDEVEARCGAAPEAVLADSGFFSIANLQALEARGLNAYVPLRPTLVLIWNSSPIDKRCAAGLRSNLAPQCSENRQEAPIHL